jgi:hypothetical protein
MLDKPAHCRSGDKVVEKKWTRLLGDGGPGSGMASGRKQRLKKLPRNKRWAIWWPMQDGYKLKRFKVESALPWSQSLSPPRSTDGIEGPQRIGVLRAL